MKKQESVLSLPVSLWLLVNYLVGYTFIYPMLIDWICANADLSVTMENVLKTAVYVFVFVTTVVPSRKLLRYGWERLTDSFGKCVGQIIRSQLFIFALAAGISMILSRFGLTTSRNQQRINSLVQNNRFYYTLMAVVFAPFVEELVFRGAIFNSFRARNRKALGYFISAFVFGFIHVMGSFFAGDYRDCLFIFIYGGLGMVLAYVYDRTDSVFCSILLHMLNNAISLLGV